METKTVNVAELEGVALDCFSSRWKDSPKAKHKFQIGDILKDKVSGEECIRVEKLLQGVDCLLYLVNYLDGEASVLRSETVLKRNYTK